MISRIIPKQYLPIISDYAKILIPAIITYLVTRYSLNRPRKYEIRSKQFDLVYLPLYLLSKQLISDTPEHKNLTLFIRKVDKIIYKNYPFVYPKTIRLFNQLKESVYRDVKNTYYVNIFVYQLESDYEKLKHELGYPTNSFIDFLKRLNRINKIVYFTGLIFLLGGIYFATSFIALFLSLNIIDALSALICSLPCFFLSYLMFYSQR